LKTGRGFSLLELLVAVALLALLAALGFRGLSSILDAEAHVQAETRRWSELAVVMGQLGQDLSLALARPVATAAGELAITRLGESDAGALQSGPRRVSYRLRGATLEYQVGPSASPILENVAALEVRALGPDGAWAPLRPAPGQAELMPRALEAQIVLAGGERITRLFILR
jgi:general secretion pathway protein J